MDEKEVNNQSSPAGNVGDAEIAVIKKIRCICFASPPFGLSGTPHNPLPIHELFNASNPRENHILYSGVHDRKGPQFQHSQSKRPDLSWLLLRPTARRCTGILRQPEQAYRSPGNVSP